MDQFHESKEKVDKKLQKYEKLNELEQQTGVDKFFFAAGAVVIGGLILYLVGGTRLIVNLVGFFYPAYMSFKAIGTADKQDDKQWLTYWIVYGIFDLSEQTTSLLENWCVTPFFAVSYPRLTSLIYQI